MRYDITTKIVIGMALRPKIWAAPGTDSGVRGYRTGLLIPGSDVSIAPAMDEQCRLLLMKPGGASDLNSKLLFNMN